MSRRHGRPHHHERPRRTRLGPARPRTSEPPARRTPPSPRPAVAPSVAPATAVEGPRTEAATPAAHPGPTDGPARPDAQHPGPTDGTRPEAAPGDRRHGRPPMNAAANQPPRPGNGAPNDRPGPGGPPAMRMNGGDRGGPCTAPQLRRFIKSRPYVPMHELRRRFAIDGGDDDVSPVSPRPRTVFVGLPDREGGLLGELLRSGEIGYELSLDPRTPIVIGVYPMRPVPRS